MEKRILRAAGMIACAAALTICACSCGSAKAPADTETAAAAVPAEPDDIVIVDYADPLVEVKSGKMRCIYEADGLAWDNVFSLPAINVDLPGAAELNVKILDDFEKDLGMHFDMLDDLSGEAVREGEPFVSVTYDYRVSVDMLAIVVYTQRGYPASDGTVNTVDSYRVYYYDALTDAETDLFDYVACHGISEQGIAAGLPDGIDVDSMKYIVCEDGENKYSVYYDTDDGAMAVVQITVEPEHLLSEIVSESN